MHLLMILAVIVSSWLIRYLWKPSEGNHNEKWRGTLFYFLFPPLLIVMTAIALIDMGPQGQMGGLQTGWFSYILASASVVFFIYLWFKLGWKGRKSINSVLNFPQIQLRGTKVRLLDTEAPFAAQIGFWEPKLVISQGLIDILSGKQLEAVIAHEKGHYHYRDTFWFFLLGWVRSCSTWLPNTQELWDELIVLRELRADAYAAEKIDPLVLAESLLIAAGNSPLDDSICCAALDSNSMEKLEQRIDALISPSEISSEITFKSELIFWNPYLLALIPLVSILFHT